MFQKSLLLSFQFLYYILFHCILNSIFFLLRDMYSPALVSQSSCCCDDDGMASSIRYRYHNFHIHLDWLVISKISFHCVCLYIILYMLEFNNRLKNILINWLFVNRITPKRFKYGNSSKSVSPSYGRVSQHCVNRIVWALGLSFQLL